MCSLDRSNTVPLTNPACSEWTSQVCMWRTETPHFSIYVQSVIPAAAPTETCDCCDVQKTEFPSRLTERHQSGAAHSKPEPVSQYTIEPMFLCIIHSRNSSTDISRLDEKRDKWSILRYTKSFFIPNPIRSRFRLTALNVLLTACSC